MIGMWVSAVQCSAVQFTAGRRRYYEKKKEEKKRKETANSYIRVSIFVSSSLWAWGYLLKGEGEGEEKRTRKRTTTRILKTMQKSQAWVSPLSFFLSFLLSCLPSFLPSSLPPFLRFVRPSVHPRYFVQQEIWCEKNNNKQQHTCTPPFTPMRAVPGRAVLRDGAQAPPFPSHDAFRAVVHPSIHPSHQSLVSVLLISATPAPTRFPS